MKVTRRVILIIGIVLFIILVGVFFGVFLNRGGDNKPTNSVEVTTRYGKIGGEWRDGGQGQGFKYASFRGIPYAQPPLGELRFKGPKPPQNWTNVLQATKDPSACLQDGTVGSEDCLYLNVYTPKLPTAQSNPKLAVYVFIHGGIFQHGDSSLANFGPDFLVQQDIVVVTMNYRIGVMASLSLDTDDIPGNAGLKDQLQVLRWVNENIEMFGGDPSKVTLGGHSSGSVSASWLSILPQTKDLIRSAIIQSGTAVSGWGLTEKNIDFAKAIYQQITGKQSDDFSEITKVVKSAKYLDLYYAAENATLLLQQTQSLGSAISFFYLPSIEKRAEGQEERLITKDAEAYIMSKDANTIPIILGETKQEWTRFFALYPMFNNESLLNDAIKNLKPLVPNSLLPGDATKASLGIDSSFSPPDEDAVAKEIQDYYFNNNQDPNCNTNCKMAKYLHHVYIMVDSAHLLRLRSKYSPKPTYAYMFSLKSDYNSVLPDYIPDYLQTDVVHGDEMRYIWRTSQDYYANTTASRTVRRLVTMWTNFIKDGNPTPQTDDLITVQWKPVQKGDAETFLEFTEDLTQRSESLEGKDTELWSKLFLEFRDGKSP